MEDRDSQRQAARVSAASSLGVLSRRRNLSRCCDAEDQAGEKKGRWALIRNLECDKAQRGASFPVRCQQLEGEPEDHEDFQQLLQGSKAVAGVAPQTVAQVAAHPEQQQQAAEEKSDQEDALQQEGSQQQRSDP